MCAFGIFVSPPPPCFVLLGWAVGGDNTSAYMLVYVRECDLPKTMLDLSTQEDNVSEVNGMEWNVLDWLKLLLVVV